MNVMQLIRAGYASGGAAPAPNAPVILLIGQSLNVSRLTNVLESAGVNALMPVDGVSVVDFAFFGTNQDFCMNHASIASAVQMTEGAGQSPCAGVSIAIPSRQHYIVSVAVGGRKMATMMSRGQRPNIYAALHRMCAFARADGYNPKVYVYSAHGEADAAAATSGADYYDQGMDFYRGAQLAAAQAMGDPEYVAPLILTYPVQQSAGDSGARDRAIKSAIFDIGRDLAGAIVLGPIYQWPCESDRIHPTPASYVLRGEAVGRLIEQHVSTGQTYSPLTIESVTLDGSDFAVTFSAPVERDDSLGVGSNLNTSFARDGMEWVDNGSYVQITGLTYNGTAVVTGTLASTPVGTIEQQELRIAVQTTTSSLTTGHDNLPGSLIRKVGAGWVSIFDGDYTNYDWASPQICSVEVA